MRTIILLLASIAIYSMAFINHKCEHVFTEVEQANVKVERPEMYRSTTLPGISRTWPDYSWPTGLQEGKELICVKCFHKQKQMLDYGQPADTGAAFEIPDSWRATTLTDTSIYGAVTISRKGDTLIWSTVK